MATLNWLVTCRCENPVEYVCNTCGEKLCSNCKQTHLQNLATKHHSVVEYAKKLMPGSLSSPPCHDHDGKECICWCQTCSKAACVDCVTSIHNGHKFAKLETVLQEKRTSLQKELENLESNVIKEWQDLMTEAGQFTSDFLGQVNGIEKELEVRAKEFHKRVDEIKENAKKQLNELKISSLAILHEQEKKLSQGLEKVKQEIKECEDQLRSGDVESLLKHEGAQDSKEDNLPTVSSVSPPVLTPYHIDTKSLTEMFGQLTVTKTTQLSIDTSSDTRKTTFSETSQATAAGKNRPIQATFRDIQRLFHGTTDSTKPQTQLIPKPSIQSEFQTGSPAPSLACVGSNRAWVQAGGKKLQLMDRQGSVKETIHTDFSFNDITVSPQGEILLSDRVNKCIKSVSADRTVKTLCNVKWEPRGLCSLHSGDIAVTFEMAARVIIYSPSWKVVKEIDKKLFIGPYSIAQSKVNSDLYISDPEADKVVALDKDYRVRYEYTGQRDWVSFTPRGLCTDNAGHVLITDYMINRVHILDKDGQFLQHLLTGEQGLKWPYSIDVDSARKAWVGESEGGVKVVKYLKYGNQG